MRSLCLLFSICMNLKMKKKKKWKGYKVKRIGAAIGWGRTLSKKYVLVTVKQGIKGIKSWFIEIHKKKSNFICLQFQMLRTMYSVSVNNTVFLNWNWIKYE